MQSWAPTLTRYRCRSSWTLTISMFVGVLWYVQMLSLLLHTVSTGREYMSVRVYTYRRTYAIMRVFLNANNLDLNHFGNCFNAVVDGCTSRTRHTDFSVTSIIVSGRHWLGRVKHRQLWPRKWQVNCLDRLLPWNSWFHDVTVSYIRI